MKNFVKGQEVTYISSWDGKGTFRFTHGIVYSAGQKQMILTDAVSGEEMGRNYRPYIGMVVGTFPRMTDAEATEACIKAAAGWLPTEIASHKRLIAHNAKRYPDDKYYAASMETKIAELEAATPAAHHYQGFGV